MLERLRKLNLFQTPETRRLAALFAIVYFAQGMYTLPDQSITILFKDQGLTADQVARFFLFVAIPWFIKPLYGLISDFVPLFGRRRKSYLLLSASLACLMAVSAAVSGVHTFWQLMVLYTAMGFGLAFTDVLTDALMVEKGKPRGLTGAFQSVQWASVTCASVLVGVLGGFFAQHRDVNDAFMVFAAFPLVIILMTVFFVEDPPAKLDAAAVRNTWVAVREALGDRPVWLVAAFIFLFNFSPSFGPAFLYYETDVLKFDQQYIGILGSVASVASVVGAAIYAPLSRRIPLRRLINIAIGLSVVTTLAYLLYRGAYSALLVQLLAGSTGMITQLAMLDLAAKACPPRVEATFFALLMSVFNVGTQLSQNVGAYLYTAMGAGMPAYTLLVVISAATTAAIWLLVPLVRIEAIEARAAQAGKGGV